LLAHHTDLSLSPFLSHFLRRGLLTRRQLTVGPEFGITLNATEALDGFHVIFGTVLEGFEVLEAIALVPTYSYKTKTGACCERTVCVMVKCVV
jgi:cyclophilin family peptidyl-prolyl cis-trans isomerase